MGEVDLALLALAAPALAGANRRWPSDYGRTQDRGLLHWESREQQGAQLREYGDKVPSLSEANCQRDGQS